MVEKVEELGEVAERNMEVAVKDMAESDTVAMEFLAKGVIITALL